MVGRFACRCPGIRPVLIVQLCALCLVDFLRIRPILIVQACLCADHAGCAPSMIPAGEVYQVAPASIPGVQDVRSRPLICRIDRLDQAACAPHWLQCFRPVVRPRLLQLKSTSCTGLIRPLVRAADSGRLCGSTSNRLADHRRLCASLVALLQAADIAAR